MKIFQMAPILLVMGLLLGTSTLVLQSCRTYDEVGFQNATNLSTKLPALMGRADTTTYASNKKEIEAVTAELNKAEEHCGAQKRNKEITSSWKILRTEQVEPFLMRWKAGKLDKDLVREAVAQVRKSLDAIKKAEQGRSK